MVSSGRGGVGVCVDGVCERGREVAWTGWAKAPVETLYSARRCCCLKRSGDVARSALMTLLRVLW